MDYIDEMSVNAFTNEMHPDQDMLHLCVTMRIVGASNSACVITHQCSWIILFETEFSKEIMQP